MACECDKVQWPFLQKIRGENLDRDKMLRGEEDLRGFLGRHAADLPPTEAMLLRLRKFDPGL